MYDMLREAVVRFDSENDMWPRDSRPGMFLYLNWDFKGFEQGFSRDTVGLAGGCPKLGGWFYKDFYPY